ncbi:hypothetical protein, partial [Bacteroides pyogenes]|uniref:hypothetical protein n=1 Tax=Bacteroides pyogenes TaxID=310300 RepID=UPI001CA32570
VFLAVHNNFCNFFSCHHKFYFLGTKILVEEIAENTWFTGGLQKVVTKRKIISDYFSDSLSFVNR